MVGVIELSLQGRGPKRGFVFDGHRFALPCWAAAEARGALLITFDRHFDTVPPVRPREPGVSLEHYALHQLDARNFDHVLAAMSEGIVSNALVIARARPQNSVGPSDTLVAAPTLDALLNGPDAKRALELVERAPSVLLDFDLDCFTTPSDADPTTVVPWTRELIRDHVLPRGSEAFWSAALPRCSALTIAREPKHCGGLIAAGRLFEQAAEIIFRELLATDLP
jgi:hypothetical protein